jgi:signal transduction histidine kinase
MSSAPERDGRPLVYGLRIGVWYATLFVAGSMAIVTLTYLLASASLAQRDRQLIDSKLGLYATAYERGGLDALAATVQAEQQTAPERLFVRVVDRGAEAIVLSQPQGWDVASLETGSIRLADGTLVQVGKSTEARDDLLARFRAALGLVTLSVVLIALTGGMIATRTAVKPIRQLTEAVQRIIATGRTDSRVPIAEHRDAIGELSALFNAMLDKIEGLVTGMRGALDNVSHDLRTPMTRLRGSAELALAGPPDIGRYREALADCVEEADRVLVMLTTLMDITEAESGAMPLKREPVALADIVARAVDLYRDTADAKGVMLSADADDGVRVSVDRTRLEQVAANLLDNAIKYTPAGSPVEINATATDQNLTVEVADRGPGLAPGREDKVFEKFYQTNPGEGRGAGLGLAICQGIVRAHGGRIWAQNLPGGGVAFLFTLPLGERPRTPADA